MVTNKKFSDNGHGATTQATIPSAEMLVARLDTVCLLVEDEDLPENLFIMDNFERR